MRKRKSVLFFGLLLMMSVLMGLGGKTSTVYAVKSINNTLKKEKIKKKIEINQKLFKTLCENNMKLKKWKILNEDKRDDFLIRKNDRKSQKLQKLMNDFFSIREKSLVSFQNEVVKKLANDLNENVSYTKYILECFGWKKDIISFIFGKDKFQKLNVKFEKMGCCPELIIKINRKFNSQDEKHKFINKLKEKIMDENLNVFFNPGGVDDDGCRLCIVLV
ncbi:MAG: hypothetical protein IJI84_06255 [Clostridia bacterium]|nr:hypothetical protein [Clostridia bacterium]